MLEHAPPSSSTRPVGFTGDQYTSRLCVYCSREFRLEAEIPALPAEHQSDPRALSSQRKPWSFAKMAAGLPSSAVRTHAVDTKCVQEQRRRLHWPTIVLCGLLPSAGPESRISDRLGYSRCHEVGRGDHVARRFGNGCSHSAPLATLTVEQLRGTTRRVAAHRIQLRWAEDAFLERQTAL